MTTPNIDIYDSEVHAIGEVMAVLQDRAGLPRDLEAFSQEIKQRFADIGFVAKVSWFETNVEDVYMPEVSIVDRVTPIDFDRDRMTHEVTNDLLGLGEGGVIKTDTPEFRAKMQQAEQHKH